MTKVNEFLRPHLNILNQYIKDLSFENPTPAQTIQKLSTEQLRCH